MPTFIPQDVATTQEKLKREFYEEADRRYADFLATGRTISWNDMRLYLENRIKEIAAEKP